MKFQAIAVVTLGVGAVLGLTREQAARRRACTAPITGREGWYRSTAQVQFKRGETFLYEGGLPKSMAVLLEWEGKSEETAPAETKAQRKARLKAAEDAANGGGSQGPAPQP